jgi:hypothetical protein
MAETNTQWNKILKAIKEKLWSMKKRTYCIVFSKEKPKRFANI